MGLLRTVIALIILVILAHTGLSYLGYGPGDNQIIELIFQMGGLLEIPAEMLLPGREFYTTALSAAGGYFLIYLLLGIGGRS
ncbi:MAG: hypothetical protein L0G70_10870 [Rubrobacter sp.]|nr:hypothetical protein [Rubrobacter sp.]